MKAQLLPSPPADDVSVTAGPPSPVKVVVVGAGAEVAGAPKGLFPKRPPVLALLVLPSMSAIILAFYRQNDMKNNTEQTTS